jgi:hypothetical protein
MVAGLISQVRDATTLVCHANYDVMRGLVDFLVAECCTGVAECKDTRTAAWFLRLAYFDISGLTGECRE